MADNKIQVLLEVDDKGTASLQRFGRTVAQTGKDGERAFSAMSASSSKLARGVATLAASYVSLQGVRALITIADQYTNLEGRLRLVTSSTAELAAVETQLYAVAQQTRVGYAETVELYTRLARATKDTGISQTELMSTVQAVNQALIVSGATTTEANAALIQFSQGMASGVLRGEELNSVMEQTPRIAQMIADGLGISTGQLREWGKEGKLTTDVVMPAIQRSAEDVNREFGLMPTTVAQAGTVLSNTLKSLVADANSGSGATAELATAIIDVSTAVDANRENILSIFADIVTAAAAAGKAILNIANSVKGFAAVAAGELSLKEFAGMGSGELTQWMKDYDSGLATIRDRVKETAATLKELREQDPDLVDEDALGRAERAFYAAQKEMAAFEAKQKEVAAASKQVAAAQDAAATATTTTTRAVNTAGASKEGLAKASKAAEKAAKKLAAEQKRLAKETEDTGRAMIDDMAKRRELTAELRAALFDTSDAYDTLGLTSRKSYEDQVKAATDAYERILSIEDLTDSERARLREGLQKTLIKLEDDYRGKVEETTGAIAEIWTDLTDETKEVLHDWVENAIKLEFDNVGEAFESLAKAMLDVWIDMIAKMIAEWVGSGLLGLFTGQGLGGFGAAGGSLIGKGFEKLFGGGTVGTLADWGLTAAGTSSLLGGTSSLLGGGASSAAFDWGLSSFGAPALGGSAAATGAATLFGEQAAAGFTASLDTAMAGGLEWVAIPGKEFFGTGASGAAGGAAGAGLSTGAMVGGGAIMGLGALIAMGMGNKAKQEFYSPRYGNVPFSDYGHDDRQDLIRAGRSGYNWVSDAQPGSISGSGDAGITQTVADLERAFTQFEQNTRVVLDVLAAAGDGVATLGQQLEDGKLSTDAFVDAIAGYDVSIQDTANLTSLASDAARGNGDAMDSLRAALQSMGLGADQAEIAALALVAASNNQSSALYAASAAANSAAGAISGMVSNINTLSSTPLNIRVGAEPYRIDNFNPYAEHAAGGIFAGPTLIPSVRGTRHLVGESGAEAITPLHAGPKTLEIMHNDIKAIAARPVHLTLNLDGRQIGNAVLPMVDAHVAAKATRGALATQTRFR